ncbi:DUF350 domain-containing protein [Alkalicoccobacillus plakortidis]|jgi:putative membrane protein|uniref:DUF350 domain-containing protein n=1 Tax=Alkalicoccobacillus plakortidis TaxID=444060 RepID=A0ABT0XH63_9BACI|nr:DUF350 domain-containing protein [Alkalicoccobacillus plakortidis]MCM2675233.1 DUF350 domain-containing protein [Alkalicoccobacillus plakortidis]
MEQWIIENEYVRTLAFYSVSILALVVFLAVFETVTTYKNWEEIKNGNLAVAMATSGKIFGVANIFRHSIQHSDSLLIMLMWGAIGFVLLLISYFIFEFLMPSFKVDEEIKRDNRAVGLMSMVISIGLSYVIGAGIITR